MSPAELVRRSEPPDAPTARAARAGTRVAALGLATLGAAGRLRRLRASSTRERTRERALVLRDVSRQILDLHGVAVDADGALPLGATLLASNHVSWLDPLVVASQLPCVPVAKLEVGRWPVIGTMARELGVVFVSRGDTRSGALALQSTGAALGDGVSVLNFPEGTTTDGGTLLPFRPGLFGLAVRLGVPVVPVAIAYDPPSLAWVGDATFLPHYLTLATRRRARAFLRLGSPIVPAANARALDVARAVHGEVARLLREIPCPSRLPSST